MSEPAAGFLDAVRALADALRELDLPWIVIGGVAVIARGVPRSTVDVDATVSAGDESPDSLLDVLGRHGIVPRIADAAGFARERQVLLLRHAPSGVPVDVSLALLPFEQEAIARADEMGFAGVLLRVATAEDLLIYKLVAARPRDLDDADALLALHARQVDVARVRAIVRAFADVLETPERVAALERLLARAGLSS